MFCVRAILQHVQIQRLCTYFQVCTCGPSLQTRTYGTSDPKNILYPILDQTAIPLLFCKNPASHFLYIPISRIPFPISANFVSQEQSNPEPAPSFSEIPDPENTLPEPVFRPHWPENRTLKCGT